MSVDSCLRTTLPAFAAARYQELKVLLKKLPPHSADGDKVSRQVSLNRRLTPSGCRDEVVRACAHLLASPMCRWEGAAWLRRRAACGWPSSSLAPAGAQAL